jgi:type VI secretion system protein ImpK
MDSDKTQIPFSAAPSAADGKPQFQPVAVAPGFRAPCNAPYLAEQTSFDEYTPGLNPLVNAASHLLLEMVRLRRTEEADLESLRSRLEAEIRGFNALAVAQGVSEAQVNAAQYLLCTALDEGVTTSAIPNAQSEWQHKSLLSTFHKDTWGGEIFFDVLARTMEQPASRLYLLELIYLLLSLGFAGKYRMEEKGILQIESLRDQIYRQIRLLRGDPSPDLSGKLTGGTFRNRTYLYAPAWLITAVVVFCLSVTWWGFSHTLEGKAGPLHAKYVSRAPVGRPFVAPVTGVLPEVSGSEQPAPSSETPPVPEVR